MSSFRFPVPSDLITLFKKMNIHSEHDLIDYLDGQMEKQNYRELGLDLRRYKKMKKMFFLYQLHKNNGEQPFLLNFSSQVQKTLMCEGILDENHLRKYSLNHTLDSLVNKGKPSYKLLRDLIENEEKALDHFFDHFTDKATRILKKYEVYNANDLRLFIEKTKLKAEGLGPRSKVEIQQVFETKFQSN